MHVSNSIHGMQSTRRSASHPYLRQCTTKTAHGCKQALPTYFALTSYLHDRHDRYVFYCVSGCGRNSLHNSWDVLHWVWFSALCVDLLSLVNRAAMCSVPELQTCIWCFNKASMGVAVAILLTGWVNTSNPMQVYIWFLGDGTTTLNGDIAWKFSYILVNALILFNTTSVHD